MKSDRPEVRLRHGDSTNSLQDSAANHPDPREIPTLTFGNSPEIRADNFQ
jgi:hypothetical protein